MHLQSFEPTCLRRLRDRTDLRLVQLVEASGAPADFRAAGEPATYDDLVSPRGLRVVSRYADAVGLAKIRLLRSRAAAEALVDHAHLSGLQVLAWTVREEPQFLAPGSRDAAGELTALLDAGVDGVFCDHPDVALAARDAWRPARVGR